MVDHRWAFGAVSREDIIRLRSRSFGVHRTHGDDVWIYARDTNQTVPISTELVVTSPISRRRDYHQARLPSCFRCLAERILSKAFENRSSQRKIQDANVEGIFQSDGTLDRRNNIRIRASTVAVENLEVDQVHPRGNSNNRTA